jgi:hypothetical protein
MPGSATVRRATLVEITDSAASVAAGDDIIVRLR